ncbi:hypothetical protein IJ182_03425 [bacterium]|nr:hypothetical protein [bacterium]
MKVNNVSFGNIVKVNAPIGTAIQIADIVNGKETTKNKKLQNQLNTLFPEKSTSIYIVSPETSYLLDGKEGKQFDTLCSSVTKKLRTLYKKHSPKEYCEVHSEKIMTAYHKKADKIINSAQHVTDIDVKTDSRTGNISSININA